MNGCEELQPEHLPETVSFCPDYCGIFDHKYRSYTSNIVGKSGWNNITQPEDLHKLMKLLYWYNLPKFKEKCIRTTKQLCGKGMIKAKSTLTQILATINGILTKMFLTSGDMKLSYYEIATWTQNLFIEIAHDYLDKIPRSLSYENYKEFCNLIKENFAHPKVEKRQEILDFKFSKGNWPISKFIDKYRKRVLCLNTEGNFFLSIQWLLDMSIWSQTRNMGYLPLYLRERTREQFYKIVTEPEVIDMKLAKTRVLLINKALQEQFASEFQCLALDGKKQQILSEVHVPIKLAASIDSTIKEGGRLEDARIVMNHIIKNDIKIPVYNIYTGEILDYLDHKLIESNQPFLFWYSFQRIINIFSVQGVLDHNFYKDIGEILPNLFDVEILHIEEAAKERVLTKGNSLLTWFLTPCAKILQLTLAENPDHKNGLEGSSQGWRIQREWGPLGQYNKFMYDHLGNRLNNIWVCDSDWTQSSDYIRKSLGLIALDRFSNYTGFPKFYWKLVKHCLAMDLKIKPNDDIRRFIPDEKRHYIHRGFMMGLPVTKPLLHLLHVMEKQFSIDYMRHNKIHYESYNLPFPKRGMNLIARNLLIHESVETD